jgi:hypothetical protein
MKPGIEKKGSINPSSQSQARDDDDYKNTKKKQSNKDLCCPFACPNCQSLGKDLVKSKYEIINILSDTGDSIFSPMHERYHDDDDEDYRSIIRKDGVGKVFLSVELVDSFFQQNFKK